MATYAIGDVQGCYSALQRLLDLIHFDDSNDQLWFAGDIVNRGSNSLSTLRFIKSLGDAAIMVLGNHDCHLIMCAAGMAKLRPGDTLQPILEAHDRDELLHWLRQQKLLHVHNQYVMVHAGLLSSWRVSQASQYAQEIEGILRAENYQDMLSQLYGNEPVYWDDKWVGADRFRVIVNAMTRMRICSVDGRMDLSYKGDKQGIPEGFMPWFEVPQRASHEAVIICGHWSALGLNILDNLIALDTGCLWGGCLTAIRLEDRKLFQISCEQQAVRVT